MINKTVCLGFFLILSFSLKAWGQTYIPCSQDPERIKKTQSKLRELEKLDQEDRKDSPNIALKKWSEIHERDRQRRIEVGKIFGEGCMLSASDFATAALIYQHGENAEQYWEAYVFSLHGIRLGDSNQKGMAANAIDRYLVDPAIGQKQLYARQATKPTGQDCWCLHQVEKSFPDDKRLAFTGKTYQDQLQWIEKLNKENEHPECPNIECAETLKPSPQGTIPGVW